MKTNLRSLAFALTLLIAPSAWAVSIYALTPDNKLLLLDGDVPANISSVQPITGLDVTDELVGIDVRPATGQLYALSRDGSLYTIDPATAIATKVADLTADPLDVSAPFFTALTSTSTTDFGLDFNPVVDRLRVVSDADQNLRINPTNGFVSEDTSLAYAGAPDRNAGANPDVGDVAYTNNFNGATGTSLFAIDDTTLDLVTIGDANAIPPISPNSGTLFSPTNPAPHFGDVLATHEGFDVAPDGTAYIVGKHLFATGTEFVLVAGNLATGDADSHGPIGDGTIPIRDIAVAPTISFSAENYSSFENAGNATITVRREGFVNLPASVEFTTHSDTASAASDYLTTSGILNFPTKVVATSADTSDTLTFQVPVVNDTVPERDELLDLFLTRITSGQGVVGFPSVASLRINVNDQVDSLGNNIDKRGPQVLSIGLTGPSRNIDGAVVHFDEDMDPATVTDLANYKLILFPKSGLPTAAAFTSAAYDPVSRSVTLSLPSFRQTLNRRMALRVKGIGSTAVKDVNLNLLDGDRNGRRGGNAIQFFKVFSGTTVKFTDRDGDVAEIEIAQGGQIDGVRPIGGPNTQLTQFWILDPIALRSTLSGRVTRAPGSNGIVVIAEIIGLDKKEITPLLTNPTFRVNTLTFSPDGTGLRSSAPPVTSARCPPRRRAGKGPRCCPKIPPSVSREKSPGRSAPIA